jgi:exodeoxyribonuclease-3
MKLATWNVNSVRARQDRLLAWLEREKPDVVCLQELKVTDEAFPRLELEGLGWHIAMIGQRTYNGVAILSRSEISDVRIGLADGDPDTEARFIAGMTAGVRVISAYIPNGRSVGSDKWDYKLAWLRRLLMHLERHYKATEPLVLAGDFNVAPEDRDVARPDEWRDTVLCHEDGRALVRELITWGLVDTIRLHHTAEGPYSWWDYRMLGFAKGNGLRIDHILATKPLADRCTEAYVVRDERKGKQPSDHAPVVAVFA